MRLSTVLLLLIVSASLGLLLKRFPYMTLDKEQKEYLLYTIPVVVVMASGVLLRYREKWGDLIRHFFYWCACIIVVLAGYSYRDALLNSPIISSLVPQRAIISNDGSIMFRASSDGHFYMETRINNALIKFMVDTGASDITLSAEDATRIGFNPETLSYTRNYHTANGVISGAPVMLNSFAVGNITLHNIPASVNKADMGTSLLGMAFFRQLRGFSVEGDVLTLKP